MTPVITLTDAPSKDAEAAIGNGLKGYNEAKAGYHDGRPLAVLVADPTTEQVLGGVLGRTSLGVLFIDLFFLPDELRGHRLGSELLAKAEEEGTRRGCRTSFLYTISFQAPGFYERHGYREFGRIPCNPPGTSRVFMVKDLS